MVALTWAATCPDARAEYAVIDLGALVNTPTGHGASVGAVNGTGQVALTSATGDTNYHAFRFSGGSAMDLGTLGGGNSFASSINASGQVVGRSTTTAGVTHAFVWTAGGTNGVASNPQMADLNPSGATSAASAINVNGEIAGYLEATLPNHSTADRAFLRSNGTLQQLPLPKGGFSSSYAYGLNDHGHVVGEAYGGQSSLAHGFVFDGTTTEEIGDLGGGSSTPLGINNDDHIAGYSANADGYDRAFLYNNGAMGDLGTLGGHYSYATAVNNRDAVVGGSFTDADDNVYHAFVWEGSSMVDLNTKVTSRAADWVLTEAAGINDGGVIVGRGTLAGASHGFLLKPLAAGDANADGSVDFLDLVSLAQSYNAEGAGIGWEQGDFGGDGRVDFMDLVALAQNYNTAQSAVAANDMTKVPEPQVALFFVGMVMLGVRRTARQSRRAAAGCGGRGRIIRVGAGVAVVRNVKVG
jgi:probable HAF family extracellular repeat protein